VTVNFTERRRWFKLVKKLESVSEAPRPTSRFYYLEFFSANVIFWVVISFSGYIFNRYFDISIVEILVMVLFEWYCLFFYNYLFYTILKMLLLRYQHLNSLITAERNGAASSGFLQKVEFVLYTLKDAVDCFNDIFGWPLLFVILYSSLLVLDYVDDFFNINNYTDEKLRMVFAIYISLLLTLFVSCCGFF
jgi:gustatory receptor